MTRESARGSAPQLRDSSCWGQRAADAYGAMRGSRPHGEGGRPRAYRAPDRPGQDLPDVNRPAVIGRNFTDAEASPSTGFYLETLGAVLLVVYARGPAADRPPRARKEARRGAARRRCRCAKPRAAARRRRARPGASRVSSSRGGRARRTRRPAACPSRPCLWTARTRLADWKPPWSPVGCAASLVLGDGDGETGPALDSIQAPTSSATAAPRTSGRARRPACGRRGCRR